MTRSRNDGHALPHAARSWSRVVSAAVSAGVVTNEEDERRGPEELEIAKKTRLRRRNASPRTITIVVALLRRSCGQAREYAYSAVRDWWSAARAGADSGRPDRPLSRVLSFYFSAAFRRLTLKIDIAKKNDNTKKQKKHRACACFYVSVFETIRIQNTHGRLF